MEVLAKKQGGIIYDIITFVAMIIAFVLKFQKDEGKLDPLFIFICLAVGVFCIYNILDWLFTPNDIILYDEQTTIYFKKHAICLADIVDISYKCSRKNVVFERSYGSVTIITNDGKRHYARNVASCEEVAQTIIRLAQEKT